MYINSEVITSDGKKIGKVTRVEDDHLIIYNKGILRDEEFHIPMSAVSTFKTNNDTDNKENNGSNLILKLNENEVKHGHEFKGENRPNSDFDIPLEKEVIRYGSFPPSTEIDSKTYFTEKMPTLEEYICDLCNNKFDKPSTLEEHRKQEHKGPIGL